MSDRPPLNVRVDEDVPDQFRKFTREKKGRVRNEMGRLVERALKEYMQKDRFARVEQQLTVIEQQQKEILALLEANSSRSTSSDHGRHAHTDRGEQFEHLAPRVRERIETTIEHLPKGRVDYSDLERAVYNAGQTDERTIRKYRRVLESQGILLPDPENPNKNDCWIHGVRQFALICEQNNGVSVNDLDHLLGLLEEQDRLLEEEYRASLPEDFRKEQDLLINQI